MSTVWKTSLSALNLKQPASKAAKCFLEILFSGLKHLLSHTFYIWLIFASTQEKPPAFNVWIVSFNSNYYLFVNRDTGIFIYFLNAFITFLLLNPFFQDEVC